MFAPDVYRNSLARSFAASRNRLAYMKHKLFGCSSKKLLKLPKEELAVRRPQSALPDDIRSCRSDNGVHA